MLFSISRFWFSELSWKGKKWSKMTKISVSHTLHFRNHISYEVNLWHTCIYKRVISPDIFFIFVQNFDFFGIIRGVRVGMVKGQNMAQNIKNFCLSYTVSQEPYIIWLWSLLHMCKTMISPCKFHFSKFRLLKSLWGGAGGGIKG